MKTFFKYLYLKNEFGYHIIKPFAGIYQFFLHEKYLKRQVFIKKRFKKNFGYELNLEYPKSLNEKINWLKINYWNPSSTQLADKYAVREYIKERIGEEYLVPLLFNTKNPKEIIPKNLPDFPCIIKTNHDSSGGIIIRDTNGKHNWSEIQNKLRSNMSQNYYWDGRELPYKNIKPRIIVEKLLFDDEGKLPEDYKVHCFNGRVRMINVDTGRGTPNHHRNWYNKEWKREPYKWSSELGENKFTDPSEKDINAPELLQEMIRLSEKLVSGFPYIRADWYIVKNKLFFGELTFHHNGGNRPIYPIAWDQRLGEQLKLPRLKS